MTAILTKKNPLLIQLQPHQTGFVISEMKIEGQLFYFGSPIPEDLIMIEFESDRDGHGDMVKLVGQEFVFNDFLKVDRTARKMKISIIKEDVPDDFEIEIEYLMMGHTID